MPPAQRRTHSTPSPHARPGGQPAQPAQRLAQYRQKQHQKQSPRHRRAGRLSSGSTAATSFLVCQNLGGGGGPLLSGADGLPALQFLNLPQQVGVSGLGGR